MGGECLPGVTHPKPIAHLLVNTRDTLCEKSDMMDPTVSICILAVNSSQPYPVRFGHHCFLLSSTAPDIDLDSEDVRDGTCGEIYLWPSTFEAVQP